MTKLKVNFTPKQLNVLKKLLPTVKLNAYDIEIFQEIQQALEYASEDKPIYNNNKQKPVKKKSSNESQFMSTMKRNPKNDIQEARQEVEKEIKEEASQSIEVEENETFNYSNETEEIEDLDETGESQEEEPQSIFSVIDRRGQ